ATSALAGANEAELRMLIRDDEDALHLSTHHDRRRRHADRFALASLHPNSPELAAARAFHRRQIELHEKSAAGGIGHRCHLDNRSVNRRSALGNLHEKFGSDFYLAP